MRRFANDFHSWLRHSWKSLANRLTLDPKIVIHGNALFFIYFLVIFPPVRSTRLLRTENHVGWCWPQFVMIYEKCSTRNTQPQTLKDRIKQTFLVLALNSNRRTVGNGWDDSLGLNWRKAVIRTYDDKMALYTDTLMRTRRWWVKILQPVPIDLISWIWK